LAGIQGSPLLSPFLFFGKGWGLTGFNVSPLTGTLSDNTSYSTDLEHVTLRATSGNAATMMIGTRFPISLGSFTNVAITNQGLPQVGSAFPQIQYEDLGLILKATPHLQTGENINLELELQIKGLGATQLNGVPVITNRAYKGSITVKDGEPSAVAGIVEEQFNRSTAGYPGVGQLPVLSGLLNTNSKEHSRTEVMVVVTPHIVRKSFHRLENVIWDANQ
jgi:general secretion pathway protein D